MSAPQVRSVENVSLNVVRLVAASLVVVGHLRALLFVDFGESESTSAATQAFYLLGSLGHPAVIVFFALSGYWVGGGAIRALGNGSFTWPRYFLSRLTRLWLVLIPAVLVTQVLDRVGTVLNRTSGVYTGDPAYHSIVPVEGAVQLLGVPETIGNIFFLQSLWVSTIGSNTPLWSLAYEFWFYVMFPAILIACSGRQPGWRRITAFVVLSCAAVIAGPRVLLLFPIWIAGAALAWQRERVAQWLQSLPIGVLRSVQIACISATLASAAASSFFGSRMAGGDYVIGAASLLMTAALVADDRGRNAALYPVSQAAKWSYSLYAFHLPILAFIVSFIVPSPGLRWQISPETLGMFVAVLGAAFLAAYALSVITEGQNEKVRAMLLSRLPKTHSRLEHRTQASRGSVERPRH